MSTYPFEKLDTTVIILGISTLALLVATGIFGLTGINYTIHKYLGIITLCVAAVHASLALYKAYRTRQWKQRA